MRPRQLPGAGQELQELTFENDGLVATVAVSSAKEPSTAGQSEWKTSEAVGPAADDRLAQVAAYVGKDDDFVIATAAYRLRSSHCDCEVVVGAQGCYLRVWEDCGSDLGRTLGRSHCRDLEAAHIYPWVAVVVLKEDLADGRRQTYQGA